MRAFAFTIALMLAAPLAHGAVVVRHDLDSLVRASDGIVFGRVIGAEPTWRDGRIVTLVRVATDFVARGELPAIVIVEALGGEIDGLGQVAVGAPVFQVGETVGLFLQRRGDVWRVAGLAQGKVRLELRPGATDVVRQLGALTLVDRRPDGTLAPAKPSLPSAQRLDRFLIDLSAALARHPE